MALCHSADILFSFFLQNFKQCQLIPVCSAEKQKKTRHKITVSLETPCISTHNATVKSGNLKENVDRAIRFCFFVCFLYPLFFHCLSPLPPSFLVSPQIPLLSALVTLPNLLAFWYQGQTWKEVLRTRAYTLCQILLNNYEMLVPIHQ